MNAEAKFESSTLVDGEMVSSTDGPLLESPDYTALSRAVRNMESYAGRLSLEDDEELIDPSVKLIYGAIGEEAKKISHHIYGEIPSSKVSRALGDVAMTAMQIGQIATLLCTRPDGQFEERICLDSLIKSLVEDIRDGIAADQDSGEKYLVEIQKVDETYEYKVIEQPENAEPNALAEILFSISLNLHAPGETGRAPQYRPRVAQKPLAPEVARAGAICDDIQRLLFAACDPETPARAVEALFDGMHKSLKQLTTESPYTASDDFAIATEPYGTLDLEDALLQIIGEMQQLVRMVLDCKGDVEDLICLEQLFKRALNAYRRRIGLPEDITKETEEDHLPYAATAEA